MRTTLRQLEPILRQSPNEWRWYAAKVINEIPRGHLASYGAIAKLTNLRTGLNIGPRNIGWLRAHLYDITDRDTSLALHRIAKIGDRNFSTDSVTTRRTSRTIREREGLCNDPPWWKPA